MLNIKRIAIKGCMGNCGDKAYPFVDKVLKRRYGNGVTFCFDWEMDNVINQFKDNGFTVYDDNYNFKITEPEDFKVNNIVYMAGMIGDVPMLVKEIKDDRIHGMIAKVKYVNYPKKHGIWIKVKLFETLKNEISHYGEGMLEAYKQKRR